MQADVHALRRHFWGRAQFVLDVGLVLVAMLVVMPARDGDDGMRGWVHDFEERGGGIALEA